MLTNFGSINCTLIADYLPVFFLLLFLKLVPKFGFNSNKYNGFKAFEEKGDTLSNTFTYFKWLMLKHTKENQKRHLGWIHWGNIHLYKELCCSLNIFSHWKKKLCHCSWCNYCFWCTCGLSSPCLLFLPLSSSPFLSYHNHVFPPGLIKRLSNRGEWRKENGGRWQQRRVVLITPCVWKGKGGVEDLFQLINGSLSLSSSQTLPLEIICLGLT